MNPEFNIDLVIAGFSIIVMGSLFVRRILGFPLALLVSFIKAAVIVIYFSSFFNGIGLRSDDLVYYLQGRAMMANGFDPLSGLFTPEGWGTLVSMAGFHILYGWWSLLGQWLFGPYYWAPIALNVIVTFVSAVFLNKLMKAEGLSTQYRKWFVVFFLLHWDLLVWSSTLNLKDCLVMTLTIMSLWYFSKLIIHKVRGKERIVTLLLSTIVSLVFLILRLYTPILILITVMLWSVLRNGRQLIWLTPLAMVGALSVIHYFGGIPLEYFDLEGVLIGAIRFLTTPQPWKVSDTYDFILLPSIMHWVFIVPVACSIIALWGHSDTSRLFIIYLMVATLFYAFVDELQGVRHRVQLIFVIAWLQYYFLWILTRGAIPNKHIVATARLQSELS